MQQNRLTKQQQHPSSLHTSGALSQNLRQRSQDINNKLAANIAFHYDARAATKRQTPNTDALRSTRFRTQISANANNNNKNDGGTIATKQRPATSKAQDPFGANGNSKAGGATSTEPHLCNEIERDHNEMGCHIDCGESRPLAVQSHNSERSCCAFSGTRKFQRRTSSGTTTKRQRQQQPVVRRVLRKQQQRQRYVVWLTACQQEWQQRHNSQLTASKREEEEIAKQEKVVVQRKEQNVEITEEVPFVVVEGVADDVANEALLPFADSETSADTNDLTLCVNTSERDLKPNMTDFRNPNIDDTNLMSNCFMRFHNQAEDDAEKCDANDLIDFTLDDRCQADTFATTDSDTTLKIFPTDVAVVVDTVAPSTTLLPSRLAPPATPRSAATDVAIVKTANIKSTAAVNNTITNDSFAAGDINRTLPTNVCSVALMTAEVSGDLVVGDCKGVDCQKMKVNQIVAVDFIERHNCGASCNQLNNDQCDGDQNRGIGSVSTKNAKLADQPTELHEIHHNNNNNSFTTTTTANGTLGSTATTRTSSQTPSPILSHHHAKKTTTTTAANLTVGGTLLDKKSQTKLLPTRGKSLLQKTHQQQRSAEETPVSTVSVGASTERLDAIELQRLKYLNRHSCNGRLDYEAIERHLEQTELQEAQRNKSIEVLGVLLQYAVHDLDAFACPRVKAEKNKIETYLNNTLRLLDDAKTSCTRLQDQLCDKEGYYTQREEDLQALHRCEIEKAQTSLNEYQTFAQTKFTEFETLLDAKDAEHKRKLDAYRLELDNKLAQKQQQLVAAEERELQLKERLSALTISEQELNDKYTNVEHRYTQRLQVAAEREQQLNERLRVLTKELDSLRAMKENRERELRDKLNLSQDEISVLRTSQRSFNESLDRSSSGIGSPRNSSTSELARLQSEADSLHCVLELKQKEISKLSKQNEELMRDAEERAVLQGKISLLESSNEMLKSEMEIKSEKEKDFQRQIDDMQKAYNHEMVKRKRLSYDNEALQWQLKQRSEQLHIVETKLQELSAHESINASLGGSFHRSQLTNGSSLINIQMDDISPPTSPVVKGVIEKPDSVSWVLEMDDETPEAAASKMVKRAGSFRSVERSPSTRRQLSACSNMINTSLNCAGGSAAHYGNGNNTLGPNPLSQSMSATSVIRQHSSDVRHEFNNRAHSRIRSKSVSVKGSEPIPSTGSSATHHTGSIGTKSGKKLMRQSSSSSSSARKQHQLELINWKEPISSSSPHVNAIRPRTSTMCSEVVEEQQQQQQCGKTLDVPNAHDKTFYQRTPTSSTSINRKLITCDISNLNTGERLDMQSLPTHSSVHDLKKKFHEIQESAGEAMVSGTNSEDEGCSASSDEIVCSVSTSSATTGSTSSLKNSHMSLEEVLLLEKSLSLNGTPMEVSWSDDQEVFTTGSTV